jgi:hypothetical protein
VGIGRGLWIASWIERFVVVNVGFGIGLMMGFGRRSEMEGGGLGGWRDFDAPEKSLVAPFQAWQGEVVQRL